MFSGWMKPEAIQNERDRIGSTKRSRKRSMPIHLQSAQGSTEGMSDSEDQASPQRIDRRCEDEATLAASRRLIEMIVDIECRLQGSQNISGLFSGDEQETKSRQRSVAVMIAWANLLHPLPILPFTDKVLLLKHCSAPFALMHTVQRSLCSPHIVLPNDTYLSLTSLHSCDLVSAVSRLLDELLTPLRRMNVEKAELSALKALILLNPDITGISAPSRDKLREARDGVLRALFIYLCHIKSAADASVRLSNLLLTMPALFSVSVSLIENTQLGVLFGLIDEIPLNNNSNNNKDMKENLNLYDETLLLTKTPLLTGLVSPATIPMQPDSTSSISLANPASTLALPMLSSSTLPLSMKMFMA